MRNVSPNHLIASNYYKVLSLLVEVVAHVKAHLRSYHINRNSRTIGSYYIDQIIRSFEVGELRNGDYVEINLRKVPIDEFYLKHRAYLSIRNTIEITIALGLTLTLFITAGKVTFFIFGVIDRLG